MILLISASKVAKTTALSQQGPASKHIFLNKQGPWQSDYTLFNLNSTLLLHHSIIYWALIMCLELYPLQLTAGDLYKLLWLLTHRITGDWERELNARRDSLTY
jgi:hypothetical protein